MTLFTSTFFSVQCFLSQFLPLWIICFRCRRGTAELLVSFDELYPTDLWPADKQEDDMVALRGSQICGKGVPRGYWVESLCLDSVFWTLLLCSSGNLYSFLHGIACIYSVWPIFISCEYLKDWLHMNMNLVKFWFFISFCNVQLPRLCSVQIFWRISIL